jgi:hypothetical protein
MASLREYSGAGSFYLREMCIPVVRYAANDNCANSRNLRVSTLVAPHPETLRLAPSGKHDGTRARRRGMTDMTDKEALSTVPDASMLALFKSLVGFLTDEAQNRGWDDISTRLRAVETALAGRHGTSK